MRKSLEVLSRGICRGGVWGFFFSEFPGGIWARGGWKRDLGGGMGVELEVFDHEGSGGVIVVPGDEGGDTGKVEDPP